MLEDIPRARFDWIDRTAYPFAPQVFEAPGGRMHYVDEGSGPPVLLLHGNPTWSFLYRHLIRTLAPHHRCVAPDYLGFGLSEKPVAFSYAPRVHAGCIHALVEHLGLTGLTLVVHDWGGPIGLSYALDHPDNVQRLMLMNTWMWPLENDWRMHAFSRVAGGPPGRLLIHRYNLFVRFGMPLLFGKRARLTPDAHRHYLAPAAQPEARIGHGRFAHALLGASRWLRGLWRRRNRLRGHPALLVWGMKDPAFARYLPRWRRLLPAARVHRLPGVGHFVPEEAGPALGPVVTDFLQASGAGSAACNPKER